MIERVRMDSMTQNFYMALILFEAGIFSSFTFIMNVSQMRNIINETSVLLIFDRLLMPKRVINLSLI